MPSYRAFGLVIAADRPLPALLPAPDDHRPQVCVELSAPHDWPAPPATERAGRRAREGGTAAAFRVSRAPDGSFRFVYPDGIEFLVSPDGARVRGRWPAGMTLEDATEYLYGPVFALVLRLRGTVCLHASVIAAGDGCFAVLAPAGHGKSTTAAAAARRGWPIVTEDLLALAPGAGEFRAVPSYPRVRLWPDAVAGVFGSSDALPRLTPANPAWDKRYLDLDDDGYRFAPAPLPLRAVYTHERRARATPAFERLSAAQALLTLLANVYTRWQPERQQRADEFEVLQQLAGVVPVKRFRGPYGLAHVGANVTALRGDCLRVCASRRRAGTEASAGSTSGDRAPAE